MMTVRTEMEKVIKHKGHSWIRNRGRSGLQVSHSLQDIVLLTEGEYKCKVERVQKTFRRIKKSDLPLLKKLNLGVRECCR